MTNIVYSSTITRDDESASSSARSELSEAPQTVAQVSKSPYSLLGKAWSSCANPQLQVDEDFESSNLKSIRYTELKTATSEFNSSSVVGSGEFGTVFKGWINEMELTGTQSGKGIVVAVKRLGKKRPEGVTKWLEDINNVGQFHHPNLVRTVGYCTENELPIVVYEFMPRGSLEDHLFLRALSWNLRLKIALGAAKCLNFLHMNGVVHGNIKPSNILLDSDYNSKLSFGVAKDHPAYIECRHGVKTSRLEMMSLPHLPHVQIYCAGYLSAPRDVYSFGVVLFEMLIGRKVTHSELRRVWPVRLAITEKMDNILAFLDESLLDGQFTISDARRAAVLVIGCLWRSEYSRVTMDTVVERLIYMSRRLG